MNTPVEPSPSSAENSVMEKLLPFWEGQLFDEIIPFWERVGPDAAGGFNTCLSDEGRLLGRDKFIWSQWRAVWVFARLHNRFGPEPRWLKIAEDTARFAIRHGWDPLASGWRWRVASNGEVLNGHESIYADGFALYGLGELFKATRKPWIEEWARRTADSVIDRLSLPHDRIPHAPYPVPLGARVHGIPMVFSLKFAELGELLGEPRYLETAAHLQDEIFDCFHRSEWDLLVERVGADGSIYPGAEGRAVVPGHVIEDMWFQIHVARILARPERIGQAADLIRRHLEFGWDEESGGGILLAKDAEGKRPVAWNLPDLKLWWPQTEALYACLLVWKESGAGWALPWYQKIFDYCMEYLYLPEVGEWRQKLNRDNTPFEGVVELPVKDPFHLPRSLILQLELLRELSQDSHLRFHRFRMDPSSESHSPKPQYR